MHRRKNVDKFQNCVIKLKFNNIFITYVAREDGRSGGGMASQPAKRGPIQQFMHYLAVEKNASPAYL